MGTGTTEQGLSQRNAVELGWWVGYYNFVLTVIGKDSGHHLSDEACKVLALVQEALDRLLAVFGLEINVKYPTSPAEARSVGLFESGVVSEGLRVRHGEGISDLFTLGQQLMTYNILAQRTELEIRTEAAKMELSIRNALAAAIPEANADELLHEPERLADRTWVLKCLFEQRGRVFLCHASEDNAAVFNIYNMLKSAGHRPWLDKEDLLPGQDWNREIQKIIRSSVCVVLVLSRKSVAKRGYVQKEFKLALDLVDEIPENQIFLIPVLLDDCVVPDSLARFHWISLDESKGIEKLLRSIAVAEKQFAEINRPDPG